MQRLGIVFALFVALAATSCGHDYNNPASAPRDNAPSPNEASATDRALFSMQDWNPVDIVIPDIEGLRGAAFVVSESSPSGVVAIDIDSRPMKKSERYAGFENPEYGSVPKSLIITSADEAFLLTESQIIVFNPVRGYIYSAASVIEHIDIGSGHVDSNGNVANERIYPGAPSGLAITGRRIFVSSPNFIEEGNPAAANPGTVQAFDISAGRSLVRAGHELASCFNPTAISVLNGNEIAVLNTGVLDFSQGSAQAASISCVDIINSNTLSRTGTISLGTSGAFSKKMAVSFDGSRGFLGSAAHRHVYEIDFLNGRALRGENNPIVLGGAGGFVSDAVLSLDNATLFAMDRESGSIMPLDLSILPPAQLGQINIGAPAASGANSGDFIFTTSSIAVRPGTRGEDFNSEDVYAISHDTKELVAINSGRPASRPTAVSTPRDIPEDPPNPDDDTGGDETGGGFSPPPTLPPPPPPVGEESDPCQGYAQRVDSFTAGAGAGFGGDRMPDIVLGPPRGADSMRGSGDVLSLGQHGEIVLDLGNCHVTDRSGPDFIIFENAFLISGDPLSPYKELGEVGVSVDGGTFVEFACRDAAYPYTGCAGWHAVYSNPSNAISPFDIENAGGDAFDLSDIGIAEARYIRIRDIGGDGLGTTSGFDLDAASVVNGVIR